MSKIVVLQRSSLKELLSKRSQANQDVLFLENRIQQHTEHGYFVKSNLCTEQVAKKACRLSKIKIYDRVDEYVNDFLHFSDLVLANFRYIFLDFFAFCSFVFVIFCVHRSIGYAKSAF